jgi:hypothetical protein
VVIQRPLVVRAAALLLTVGLVAGCGALTTPPENHNDLLTIATGVSAFEVVMTSDLWERSTPTSDYANLRDVEGQNPGGDMADRGLELYTLSGNQLVSYLNHLQPLAYGGWLQKSGTPQMYQRIYDEIAPVVQEIDGPRGPEEPAPRVVLDDTITEGA